MRTPEQILAKLKGEKKVVEILTGQLCACQDNTYIYQDTVNFMAEALRSLDNAVEELSDIIEFGDCLPLSQETKEDHND